MDLHDAAWWGYPGLGRQWAHQLILNVPAGGGFGGTVDAHSIHRRTPMMLAIQRGHLDVVRCLIRCGANLNKASCTTYLYRTPLMLACKLGQVEIVEEILKTVDPETR